MNRAFRPTKGNGMNGREEPTSGAELTTSGAVLTQSSLKRTSAARERFAAGADSVRGVRPEILMSWYRCREEYRVDPGLELPRRRELRWRERGRQIRAWSRRPGQARLTTVFWAFL